MLKPFFGEKILRAVEMGSKMAVLDGNGGRNLTFWFRYPQKALPCAEPRLSAYFGVKIGAWVSAVAFLNKIADSLYAEGREITHAQNRNP